jgi:hypothetical protein
MKNIYKLSKIGLGVMLLALTSCGYEDPITSTVTNYAIITLNEPESDPIFIEQGETYTDPGAIATEDGVEIDLATDYIGKYRHNDFSETLDTNVSDVYTTEYSAVNQDGFSAAATRQVIVAKTGDLVNSIAGLYTSTVFRNGVQGTPASNYTDIEYVLIWENADGTYGISDTFGGWYEFGRAIAGSETPGGTIVANDIATNDFSFPGTQSNSYFGGSAKMTALTVDAATKTLVLTTTWAAPPSSNYTFVSTLTQVQF